MASQKNNRKNGMNVCFADNMVFSSGHPTPTAVLEYRDRMQDQRADEQAKREARKQIFSVIFVLLATKAVQLYEVEWKEIRVRISKERNRLPKPLTIEQNEQLVQKEHENALKDRLARAVFENFELLLKDRTEFNPHLFKSAKEVTAAQVPVSLWAKYSDEVGNPLPGNPIHKGLGKGVYFLSQALNVLVVEYEKESFDS